MADLEKTVAVLFKGVDEISGTMQAISGNLGSFGNKLEASTQPLANMALAVEKIDAALVALAVGGLAYAYTKSIGFESASIDLQKVLGTQKDKIDEAEAAATALSDAYGESSTSVLQSAANFKQAGFDYDESMSLVKSSLDLMIAGDMAAAQSSELVVSALKGFEAPASEAARYVDILNGVSNEYATNAEQLGIGLSKLSPIAKAMNFSFEETAGILTPVIEVFRSGGESADALKTGLLKLIDDSKPVRAALESIGVSQTDLNGNLRSGKDILYDVMKAFTGLAENDKLYFTQQLVGIEQSARMVKVFDNLEKVTNVTATAMNSAGSAIEEVNLRLASGQKAVDRFASGFENMGIAIGNEFRAATTSAIGGATDIEKALTSAIKAGTFDEIFDAIRDFSTKMGADLKEIAIAMPEAFTQVDFSKFLSSIKDLGGSIGDVFQALFGEVDLKTPEGLAAALQKIVDGMTKLSQISKGIVEGLTPFAEKLGQMGASALAADGSTAELTGKILGLGQGVNTAISALNNLAPAMEIFSGALIVNAISNIGTLVSGLGGAGLAAGLGAVLAAGSAAIVSMGMAAEAAGVQFVTLRQFLGGQWIDTLTEVGQELGELAGWLFGAGEAAASIEIPAGVAQASIGAIMHAMNDIPEIKTFTINGQTGEATEKINALNTSILSFPKEFSIGMSDASMNILSSFKELPALTELTIKAELVNEAETNKFMSDISQTYPLNAWVNLDQASVAKTKDQMTQIINPDGTTTWINVGVDAESIKRTEAALKELPTEKILEIKLQGEIDKDLALIKTGAETVQTAMQWKAKLDIAGIEGETKRMEAMFSTVGSTIDSVSNEIAGLFSKVPKSEFDFGAREWKKAIEQAMKIQQESFDLEKSLIEAQISIMKKKESMMMAGKGLIKIDSTGLEPALEMIMWQILQKVQMRANEDSANFLLGIG